MANGTVKVTMNLPEKLMKRFREEAEERGISITEAIRRGLETELFLIDEENSGSRLLLEKKNNDLVQLVRR